MSYQKEHSYNPTYIIAVESKNQIQLSRNPGGHGPGSIVL